MTVAGIDLSTTEFWGLPLTERAAAFALLRAQPSTPFFAEPETPFAEKGPGYYALVRHADLVEAVTRLRTSGQALADLVTGLAAARSEAPGEDLVSALVTANIDGEHLTDAELASFFILLVVAGNETTRTALSHALMLLTDHQDQRAPLLADFDGRISGAVEEIVRYVSPVIWMRRSVTRDAVVNGHQFREGDK